MHCMKMHLVAFGLFFCLQCDTFMVYIFFNFQAFSFIASVEGDRQNDHFSLTLEPQTEIPDMGLKMPFYSNAIAVDDSLTCSPCDTFLLLFFSLKFTAESLLCSIVAIALTNHQGREQWPFHIGLQILALACTKQ